jgi:hypothetical protein
MMSNVVVATFAALVVAMLALWAPRISAAPYATSWWVLPFAGALMLALVGGLVDTWGLAAFLVFATACRLVHRAPDGTLHGFALAVTLAMSAGLLAPLASRADPAAGVVAAVDAHGVFTDFPEEALPAT